MSDLQFSFTNHHQNESTSLATRLKAGLPYLTLILILVVGGVLRFTGLNWDGYTHMHPDERFLTLVETSIRFPDTVGEYFDTATSPLNPNNAGHGFFVYGTFPIFLVRLLGDWIAQIGLQINNGTLPIFLVRLLRMLGEGPVQAGYDEIHLIGRAAAAAFDVVSLLLVYLIGARLYRKRVGLLAASFSAFSVLLIQHAHFFVVESFANTFILAGIYFAVRAREEGDLFNSIFFGLALGMATASKISSAPLAAVLVLAVGIRVFRAKIEHRRSELIQALVHLIVVGLISLVTFRILQPYAFEGPSFFGVGLNPQWLKNIRDIGLQQSGIVDFPPALQWANRTPIFFALQNLVTWGLGWPLGSLSFIGLGWAAYQAATGKWRMHLIPVIWTGAYFLWRSISFTPAMRYQLPVYPTLTLLGAWAIWEAWDKVGALTTERKKLLRMVVAIGGLFVLAASGFYASAFAKNYTDPFPRLDASSWIYQNIPGAVNIRASTPQGEYIEPIPITPETVLAAGEILEAKFRADSDGEITTARIVDWYELNYGSNVGLIEVWLIDHATQYTATGLIGSVERENAKDGPLQFTLDRPFPVINGRTYSIEISAGDQSGLTARSGIELIGDSPEGEFSLQVSLPRTSLALGSSFSQDLPFRINASGQIHSIYLPFVKPLVESESQEIILQFTLSGGGISPTMYEVREKLDPASERWVELELKQPLPVEEGTVYTLHLESTFGVPVGFRGSVLVAETSWDDPLPLRVEGRDGFGGIYRGVNQELYWADDQDDDQDGVSDKFERIRSTLSEGDYLIISSNRQYGTIARVPQRYPLSTAYYRALFGCPEPKPVSSCAADASPGRVHGSLGYELVQVFENHPDLGGFEINDQEAEEAFTVYDHPKVLIFKKASDFSESVLTEILGGVDLSRIVNDVPRDLSDPEPDLELPEDRLEDQRAGGTWSELFQRDSLLNRSELLGILVWWVAIAVFGWFALPLTRSAFAGLSDGGYPLARLVGLLFVAWASWMASSQEIPFSRNLLFACLLLLGIISIGLYLRDREGLRRFIVEHKREIFWVEVLAAGLFLLFLAVRFGNADLWHPSKGGEKPMDFSYLNAVLRSTSFPPYDPWYSGGYINYYYFGFVLVGAPIRLLGIVPSFAYNLVIPTLFSLSGLAAYSVGFNLLARLGKAYPSAGRLSPRVAGFAAAIGLVLLGNLGTVTMVYDGLRQLGEPSAEGGFSYGPVNAIRGLSHMLTRDQSLPYGLDSWYWNPSRAIPPGEGEVGPITEFPFFTFLYADLHAHMINLPLTVATLGWGLAWLVTAAKGIRQKVPEIGVSLFVGALLLGSLNPTNTWDYPLYWTLGALAVAYAAWLRVKKINVNMLSEAIFGIAILLLLAQWLFQPYHLWYGQGYTNVDLWGGSHTSLGAYLTVHGLFLALIFSWMAWETWHWMATTPLSALSRVRPYSTFIGAGLVLLIGILGFGLGKGIAVTPLVLILLVWSIVLFFRKNQPVEKQIVLVMVAAGVALTLLVEVIVLRGDIGRMNTVFKFYLQVWTLFSISGAAGLAWILADFPTWDWRWQRVWSLLIGVLVLSAVLYPIVATRHKILDRMTFDAPRTLDGIDFMDYASYHDQGEVIRLDEDYRAIHWMQDNVTGSPVIVEANLPGYRWGSRYTIYTGLPGVLGWNWHQRQQRAAVEEADVNLRTDEITGFYLTRSIEDAQAFLEKYQVSYVIVGKLESIYYARANKCEPAMEGQKILCDMIGKFGPVGVRTLEVPASECESQDPETGEGPLVCPTHGLEKFMTMVQEGILSPAYVDGDTTVYKVLR